MKAYKQLASQTLIYGLGTIVPRLLNYLLLTPFYTWIFLESKYGTITEIYSYVAFLMVLLTYGMETTYFRFTSGENNKDTIFNTAFFSLFLTSTAFILLVIFKTDAIAQLIGYEHNRQYVIWFAFIVALDALTAIPFAKLRLQNKAFKFTLIKVGNILINIGFNIFFFVICRNAKTGFFANIYNEDIGVGYAFLSNLFASLFNLIVLLPDLRSFRFKFSLTLYKKMIIYALPLLIVGLSGMVNEVADKILLKYLTPDNLIPLKQVGIYGANYKLAVLMTIFIQMFKYAAEPFFFNQANNNDAKVIYAKVMNYFIIFCLLIFLLVTLYIDVFKYFIGEPYRVGLRVVPIVLLANMFLGIYYNLSVWYKLTNLTRFGAYISLVGVLITLIINIVYIPKYGYYASAWATFICYFIMMLISYFWGKKYFKINYDVKRSLLYTAIAMAMYFIKQLININYIANMAISSVLFIVFLMVLARNEKINLLQLKRLFNKS